MGNEASKSREERLAAKLRENLRRRKARARALGSREPSEEGGVEEDGALPPARENESGRLSKSPPES